MKKSLLLLVIITSCNHHREDSVVVKHTDTVLLKADSALEIHDKVKEENLKILNQVIEKYSDTLKSK